MSENREIKQWITVNGKHIPIREGESKEDAINHALNNSDSDKKDKQINANKEEANRRNQQEKEKDTEKKEASRESDNTEYKDSNSYDGFVKANLKELKSIYKAEGEEGVRERWYNMRLKNEKNNLHEESVEVAISQIRDAIPDNVHTGWFRNANSEYKPKLVNCIMGNKGTLNAGFNIGYYNYRHNFERFSEVYQKWVPLEGVDQSKKLSFEDWLNTPQTMWRGTYGQKAVDSDLFQSYTPDKEIAKKFLNESAGGTLESIQIRPIDTWGSYQTTAEQEFLIPISELKKRGK